MKRPADTFMKAVTGIAALLSSSVAWASEDAALFESKIRPIFIEHCQKCHGEKKQENGLRLDSKPGWQKGGDHGSPIKPGDPEASLLIKAVRRTDRELQMPPKHALGAEQIAALEQWVKLGAPDPRESSSVAKVAVDMTSARKHWAFQPVTHPHPPLLKNDNPSLLPLDRFVLAGLEQQKLKPNAAADRRTLIRRATFDLTGIHGLHPRADGLEVLHSRTTSNQPLTSCFLVPAMPVQQ